MSQSNSKQLSQIMADRFHIDQAQFVTTVKATCFSGQNVSDEQFAQFLMVANEYKLNPFTKEIYAFPARGGVQPIVSIDGWLNIINSHAEFDGMEFKDEINDQGKLVSVTCRMFRKDRSHPTEVTEYLAECFRDNSEPWSKWPARMLRHKATIQAARYAFGFSGIYEQDEIERIDDAPKNMGNAVVLELITADQVKLIDNLIVTVGADKPKFLAYMNVASVEHITTKDYQKAVAALDAKGASK